MNGRFNLRIITQPHSEVYCGYFRRLVFGNSLTFSHIPPCFHAKRPDFPRLLEPRELCSQGLLWLYWVDEDIWTLHHVGHCPYINPPN